MSKGYLILTVDGSNCVNDQQLLVSGNLATDIEDKVEQGMMPGKNLQGQEKLYFQANIKNILIVLV